MEFSDTLLAAILKGPYPKVGDQLVPPLAKARDASDYAKTKAREVEERVRTLVEEGKQQITAAVDAGRGPMGRQEVAKRKATRAFN